MRPDDDIGVVRHAFRCAPPESARRLDIIRTLSALPGMRSAGFEGGRLRVVYDVRRTSLEAVVEKLGELDLNPPTDWRHRVLRAWQGFTEGNLRDSLLRQPKPCCSRPPK